MIALEPAAAQELMVDTISLLNDVLGPVMRGLSSSHTVAPLRIGTLPRELKLTTLGGLPLAPSVLALPRLAESGGRR